ncbi:hypothetical protein ACFRAO_20345 [Streptomyces sp. NPDC056656]|uniref:hypothetical protein n=1 Tax=Streptomyces sp. NPDC056656 TaxID=3345895 RepID=UPI0036AE7D54
MHCLQCVHVFCGRDRRGSHESPALAPAPDLDHLDVRQGAQVCFAKTSRILADLAGGHADRTWTKRNCA